MTSRWCTHAFYKDYDGQPTLKAGDAVASDLLGKLRAEFDTDTYVRHVIAMAESLGLKGPSTYVEAFMYLVHFIDGGGDQQWAWVRYFTPAATPVDLQENHSEVRNG